MRAIAVLGVGPMEYPLTIQRAIDAQKTQEKTQETQAELEMILSNYLAEAKNKSDAQGEGWMLTMEAKLNVLSAIYLSKKLQINQLFYLGTYSRKAIEGLERSQSIQPNVSEAERMHDYSLKRGLPLILVEYETLSQNTTGNLVYLINLLNEKHYTDIDELILVCSPYHRARVQTVANILCLKDVVNFEIKTSTEIIKTEPRESRLKRFAERILDLKYKLKKSTEVGIKSETVDERINKEVDGVVALKYWPPYWLTDVVHLTNDKHLSKILRAQFDLLQPWFQEAGIAINDSSEIETCLPHIRQEFGLRKREYLPKEKISEVEQNFEYYLLKTTKEGLR